MTSRLSTNGIKQQWKNVDGNSMEEMPKGATGKKRERQRGQTWREFEIQNNFKYVLQWQKIIKAQET